MSIFENIGEYTHESYGMIQFSRITHGGKRAMFGADVNTNQLIRLTIRKNAVCEDGTIMGRRYYASTKIANEVVELDMTNTQFAELITCMNIGEGVPCTINRIGGVKIEQAEEAVANIVDKERELFTSYMAETVKKVEAMKKEVSEILSKPSISKADRARINQLNDAIHSHLTCNMDFHVQKAGETIENLVSKAKCELAASAATALINAGLTTINVPSMPAIEAATSVKEITE